MISSSITISVFLVDLGGDDRFSFSSKLLELNSSILKEFPNYLSMNPRRKLTLGPYKKLYLPRSTKKGNIFCIFIVTIFSSTLSLLHLLEISCYRVKFCMHFPKRLLWISDNIIWRISKVRNFNYTLIAICDSSSLSFPFLIFIIL